MVKDNFFTQCYNAILNNDVQAKCQTTYLIYQKWQNNEFSSLIPTSTILPILTPGRPIKPQLVPPRQVTRRRIGTKQGHASLIHALAHIEFNAINLALDACYRFQNMPHEFYTNWLTVAKDETHHFQLLNQHLIHLGYNYGSFPAHNGLWDMAITTQNDVLLRMALVPRVLEARGIDAIPQMQQKIKQIGDWRGEEILEIIQHDEIKHVLYGDKWFKHECKQRSLEPTTTFIRLLKEYNAPKIKGAFNRQGRQLAGFNNIELDYLYPSITK